MEKRWELKKSNQETVRNLQNELKIHPAFCEMLVQRNINTFEEAKSFFRTDASQLHNPFLMKGMKKAVERINQAIETQEKILIYGDYDVDGTTAVAIVFSFFKQFYDKIEFYIPHRFAEGYGLSQKGINFAIEQDYKLIITLDCGIKSVQLIDYANEHGIDVIVCDHHLPDSQLPNAIAILNPKQIDCSYPYKELCGCGIGYKLITAYAIQYKKDIETVNEKIDLVATAIAADIVPINGENRVLAVLGLEKVNTNPCVAIQAIKEVGKVNKEFTISDLVFIVAPRVNAAGRMDDARKAVELFIEKDLENAMHYASQLHSDNNDRRGVDKQITEEALNILFEQPNFHQRKTTVVYKEDWHKGVVGIVASRLIEHCYRPTIVLTESNGKISGSARSIKSFNLFEGLSECAEYLDSFGGHYFAAGLTLEKNKLDSFKEKFDEVAASILSDEMLIPEIEIDAEIDFKDITPQFVNILNQFAPHGPENMRPVFMTKNVVNYNNYSRILKDVHVKYIVSQKGVIMDGIGFNQAEKISSINLNLPFDMIYHIEENEWNGNVKIQLKVIDIRQSQL